MWYWFICCIYVFHFMQVNLWILSINCNYGKSLTQFVCEVFHPLFIFFVSRLSILYVCEKDSMANTSVNCKGRAFLNLCLVRNITELALVFIKDWIDFRGYPDQSRSMVKYKIHNHYNCDRLLLTYWSWENTYRLV